MRLVKHDDLYSSSSSSSSYPSSYIVAVFVNMVLAGMWFGGDAPSFGEGRQMANQ